MARRVAGLVVILLLVVACSEAPATPTLGALTPIRLPPSPSEIPSRDLATLTPAPVTRVVDGDTIIVRIDGHDYRLRYIGMNAPKSVTPNHPVEWMGPEASRANAAIVMGKPVMLEKDVSETDYFGRLLRYVYVGGVMVNSQLVRQGYASATTYPPDVKYQALMMEAEREARAANRGLWGTRPTGEP